MCPLFSLFHFPCCCDEIPDKRNLGNFDQNLRVHVTVAGKSWHRSMRQLDALHPQPGSRKECILVPSWLSLFYLIPEPSWWESADHLQNRPPFLSLIFLEILPRHTRSIISWRFWVLLAWRWRLTITAVYIAPVTLMTKRSGEDKGSNKETMSMHLEFQLCTARCAVSFFPLCFISSFSTFLLSFLRQSLPMYPIQIGLKFTLLLPQLLKC